MLSESHHTMSSLYLWQWAMAQRATLWLKPEETKVYKYIFFLKQTYKNAQKSANFFKDLCTYHALDL
jgi:hypothetical protein